MAPSRCRIYEWGYRLYVDSPVIHLGLIYMSRAMVFIDYMNFSIALSSLYRTTDGKYDTPRLDYALLGSRLVEIIDKDTKYIKTFLFVPKPDDFLMQDLSLRGMYEWAIGLRRLKNFDVYEGRYVARPTDESIPKTLAQRNTYYKEEKGTDVNLASQVISKAYSNAFDTSIIMSGDTDYLPVYEILKALGKIVIVAAVRGQNLNKIIPNVDSFCHLDKDFFMNCLRQPAHRYEDKNE